MRAPAIRFDRPTRLPVWLVRRGGLIVGKIRALPAGVLISVPGADLGGRDLFGKPTRGVRGCKTVGEAKNIVKAYLGNPKP